MTNNRHWLSLLLIKSAEAPSACVIEEMQSCGICLEFQVVRAGTFRRLSNCAHEFCTNCLRNYAEAQGRTGAVVIVCPQPRCKEPLTSLECSELLYVDSFRKLTERQIEAAIPEEERSYCPYRDCSALFIRPVLRDTAMSSSHPHTTSVGAVKCFNCNRLFCLECQVCTVSHHLTWPQQVTSYSPAVSTGRTKSHEIFVALLECRFLGMQNLLAKRCKTSLKRKSSE